VVFGLVILIVTAMLMFVVPMFKNLYGELGGTLPLPTRLLIGVSTVITKFFYIVFLLLGGLVFGFRRWIRSEGGRAKWDAVKLRLPIFGKLVHKTALTRFARTLAVLLRSGVPILESLEITSDTVSNSVMAAAIKDVQAAVKTGESVAKPLAHHKGIPADGGADDGGGRGDGRPRRDAREERRLLRPGGRGHGERPDLPAGAPAHRGHGRRRGRHGDRALHADVQHHQADQVETAPHAA
jgi:hypothetical protein